MNLLSMSFGKKLLLLIIIVGFLLRVNNLAIGFPILFLYNDEAIYHQSALNVIASKTLFTLGNYGPLGSYIQVPFILIAFVTMLVDGSIASPHDFELLLTTQEGYLLFIPRVISAFFGTLGIIAIYKITQELFKNKQASLWASLLFAVSFNLVHIAHQARAWSPAIFLALISVLFALKSVRAGSKKSSTLLAYLFAAFAFGFHQIAGIIIVCILLLRFFSLKKKVSFFGSKLDIFGFIAWALMVLIFNFLSLGTNLLSVFTPNDTHVGLIYLPTDSQNLLDFLFKLLAQNNFIKILSDLFLTDPVIFILALPFFFLHKMSRVILPLLIFLSLNFLIMSLIFPPFLRYLLLSISILPIFAGYTISCLLKSLKIGFGSVVGLLLLILASFNSIYWNFLISQEPTFDQVRKWVDITIPPKTPIVITSRRNFSWVPAYSSSEIIRSFESGYYLRASTLTGDSFPPNVRNVFDSSRVHGISKEEQVNNALKIHSAEYIVDWYYGTYDRLLNQKIDKNISLIAHFSPTPGHVSNDKLPETMFDAPYNFPFFKVDRPGPYFDVLKVEW